ncbi:hypothetical protein BDV95DRAFT_136699 [Massariosphaeria phaeospora]|uniref:SET domain-containing protein n=1 Tax=Massariosphaeria phaeospora TaxID=100035 RepID=A0A7C8IP60_9PLEO|nr:hypothetical protein BDV95DRAFT_136699 [Massariosphaeria phaeospora]
MVLRERLAELLDLQTGTPARPYSIGLRLKLAEAYKALGYPDLAAGDAYKALLLVDEIVDEGEYYDDALAAAVADVSSTENTVTADLATKGKDDNVGARTEDEAAIAWAMTTCSRTGHEILVGCLIDCGCLRSAFDYNTRALENFPGAACFETYREALLTKLRSYFESQHEDFDAVDVQDYPDKGVVRRELYPWNVHEPDRFSDESIALLNQQLTAIAPKLEVKATELPLLSPAKMILSTSACPETQGPFTKQLGLFAKEDIAPGEKILQEKSLLTAVSRLHEYYCDACTATLPHTIDPAPDGLQVCQDCDEAFFCSTDCYDLAREGYHPSLCGVSSDQKVPIAEVADALYAKLLVRALALAETQDLHPLDLKEVRYIWGDYHGIDLHRQWEVDGNAFGPIPRTLPFSFHANIITPLHVLEKMDVNIFERSHRYDTWVFNTLYGKFRGTASARQGLDGKPEIGAVHPMWSLANHSCDPHVTWEWQGSMQLWTRKKLVAWQGRDSSRQPGMRKGEEVLSHYCDVRLPVQERREWAMGALGGECVCERCKWEATQKEQ